MRDVQLVGLSEDGSRLVLELPGGEQVTLPLDDRIHAALRGDRARLGQLQIELESRLRPRDIQARIRAGRSLDEVAQEAGIPVDRVLRYAGPVLHEREHMAQEAAKVGIRREGQGAVTLLGELVGDRLEERGVSRADLEWDAWRREDGTWLVRLSYTSSGRPQDRDRSAQWVYDPQRRTVTPDDDEARWLIEEPTATVVTPLRPVPAEPPEPEPEPEPAPAAAEPATTTQTPRPAATPAAAPAGRQPRKRSERATVPSWDEILFGAKRPES